MKYTQEDIDKVLEASKLATPGPWFVWSEEGEDSKGRTRVSVCNEDPSSCNEMNNHQCIGTVVGSSYEASYATAALTAGAPILAEEVQKLRAEVKALRSK